MRLQRFPRIIFYVSPSTPGFRIAGRIARFFLLFGLIIIGRAPLLHAQTAHLPNIQVEHFSVEQGLADRNVTSILKDKQGYIWIATSKGLSRFDGYDFLNYNTQPRNPHNIHYSFIYRILQTAGGQILIYYNRTELQLDLLNPLTKELRPVKFGEKPPVGAIAQPFQARDGNIYLLTSTDDHLKVHRLDEVKGQFVLRFELKQSVKVHPLRINFIQANDGTFWIAANESDGNLSIIHSDQEGNILTNFTLPDKGPGATNMTDFLTETATGEIWLATLSNGVYVFGKTVDKAGTWRHHPILTGKNLAFSKDAIGNLLVYQERADHIPRSCYLFTTAGLQLDYNWLLDYQAVISRPFSEDFTRSLFAITNNGFNKYWMNPSSFSNFLAKELGNANVGISTRGMAKAGKDRLLITTEANGVYELNLKTNQISRPGDRSPQLSPLNNLSLGRNILAMGDSVFWISASRGLMKYQPALNKTTFYKITGQEIWGVCLGDGGIIWVVDLDGHLMQLSPRTGEVTEYRNKDGTLPLENTQPSYLLAARDGTLWAGSMLSGLIHIDPLKKESWRFTANPGDLAQLNSNRVACVYEDAAGLLWLGLLEGGLQVFDPRKERAIVLYTRENGLCNNNVVGILPDKTGNLWLSTFSGLSFFDAENKTFRNYYTADGLSHNEFNRHSFLYDPETEQFYFGGINGVNSFKETDLQTTENHETLLLAEVTYSDKNDHIINQYEGIVNGSTISLPPSNRLLRLHLALADYRNPAGNQFAYKIDGLDNDWNYLGNDHDLRLDHLPSGNFIIRLRGADNRGDWSSQEIYLNLVVQTYWYKRWWAWMIYALLLSAGGIYFYRFQLKKKIAEKEAHRLQELDRFKSRFFTNISHEFRTPLTVILGMAEQLTMHGESLQTSAKLTKLNLIKRNGENLLRLINRILDLAKLESNALKMNYVQGDVLPYLFYISESLYSLAQSQQVQLRIESPLAKIVMDYDPERLLQIVYNLISNAIKFTPAGGMVILRVTLEEERKSASTASRPVQSTSFVRLEVIDNGSGIPAEDLPNIFDRYYQANNLDKAKSSGTGIGLALTKELVREMGGEIKVVSKVGQGTTFTAKWPITNQAEIRVWKAELPAVANESSALLEGINDRTNGTAPSVLLIEDNPDVLEYLIACLRRTYQIEVAYNGSTGIEKALESIPDLIISDVMMPEKDGFEVCDFLKNDERTSHIPIILLTAKADMESRIAGLRRGADAYHSKPFHREEMLLTIANLLEMRKKLQARFANVAVASVEKPILDVEDVFVQKVRSAVEMHLSDVSFSVDQLCRLLTMSQPQLHRKISALTGKNATLFIRAIRLERAKLLLMQKGKTVREVAFEVGFEDPKYFSRVFVETFGIAPSKI